MEEILEAGLDLVLVRQAQRNGLVEKPQSRAHGAGSRRSRTFGCSARVTCATKAARFLAG
jgi:hypothetical protein